MKPAAALVLEAPAKVNLGLRIRGRRPDGYHLLESLFAPLDLTDRLRVEVGSPAPGPTGQRVSLRVSGERAAGVPADASNLVVRAAEAFLAAAERPDLGVAIELEKRVPAQAGLGGGSSDAGAVLRALGALLPGAVAQPALAAMALRLGADVPFFLDPRPAWVRGIGEQIEPLPGLAPLVLLLVHPGAGLSTAAVYAAFDAIAGALTPPACGPTVTPPEGPLEPETLARLLENDLEPAALRLCPPLLRLRQRIAGAGALAVGMSGSGPTLFGVFSDEPAARQAAARMDEEAGRKDGPRSGPAVWARVARTVSAPKPAVPVTSCRELADGASPNW